MKCSRGREIGVLLDYKYNGTSGCLVPELVISFMRVSSDICVCLLLNSD